MKVAAYQAPLEVCRSPNVVAHVRAQVDRCEFAGVELLCCPEAVLGGLADYADDPEQIAINVESGELARVLAPLASETVTTVIGFTERDRAGHLYNSAAVFQRGTVIGVYRKHHPAINRSVYRAGSATPVFAAGGMTFGVIICLDSQFTEPAASLVALGAKALLVPTNNGLPPGKGGVGLIADSRACDARLAVAHGVYVIRADVTGVHAGLTSHGSSGITAPGGSVVASAAPFEEALIIISLESVAPLDMLDSSAYVLPP
jgi:predicted amidohydrolase